METNQDNNEVPEFLNELIPYRCPKCGHTRRFSTLRELRQHLQIDHAYKMGCVKPHPRASIFNNTLDRHGLNNSSTVSENQKNTEFQSTEAGNGHRLNIKYQIDKLNSLKKDERESSPLLKSFKDETAALERELQRAKQMELAHKATSLHNLSNSSINSDFKLNLENIHTNFEPKTKGNNFFQQLPLPKLQIPNTSSSVTMTTSNPDMWRFPRRQHNDAFFSNSFPDRTQLQISNASSLQGRIHDNAERLVTPLQSLPNSATNSLNSEVLKSRFHHWATSDALYETQDLLRQMEKEAENKCKQQREIIEQLAQGTVMMINFIH